MEWKDIATTVGRVAPALGGLLTGPLGVAITAGGLIAQALGTDPAPDAVEKAIATDPAAGLRLRELESAERVQIQALQMQVLAAQLADVQSARSRDVQLQQLGHRNTRADVMVFAAAVGLIACLVTMVVLQGQLPGEVVGIISTVAGIFGACLRDAFQFEFGSSRGSEVKTALLAQADAVRSPSPTP